MLRNNTWYTVIHVIQTTENNLGHSRKLASLGNRAAKDGHFGEAVRRYSEAIVLYPYDHRYDYSCTIATL